MIRDAQFSDLPRIVEMGNNFRGNTSYHRYLGENQERMKELAIRLLENKCLLVSEEDGNLTGMLGFIVYSHFISGDLMAGEIFWWVEPEYRGHGVRLLKEMERRARAAGAKYIQMIAPLDNRESLAGLYGRMGYTFVEETHQRAL